MFEPSKRAQARGAEGLEPCGGQRGCLGSVELSAGHSAVWDRTADRAVWVNAKTSVIFTPEEYNQSRKTEIAHTLKAPNRCHPRIVP